VPLHECARDAEGEADQQSERRPRDAELADDDRLVGGEVAVEQGAPHLAHADRAGADGDAGERRGDDQREQECEADEPPGTSGRRPDRRRVDHGGHGQLRTR
jgi:hypothetical protein